MHGGWDVFGQLLLFVVTPFSRAVFFVVHAYMYDIIKYVGFIFYFPPSAVGVKCQV